MIPLAVLCSLRIHCVDCRDRERGRAWRESLGGQFTLPAGWPECPLGFAWGITERPAGDGSAGKACCRCGAAWHTIADCPIPEGYVATPANATAGGCGCAGDQQRPAGGE